MDRTRESVQAIVDSAICSTETHTLFTKRIAEPAGSTRDENPQSHFCAYFLPYNAVTKQLFIIHHKKSGLWLSPGGHIDKGETLHEALNREIEEELGVKSFFTEEQMPFLLSTATINNTTQPCKMHYDVWYLMPTDGSIFNVDPHEFLDTKWVTVDEARKIVVDPGNLEALDVIERM